MSTVVKDIRDALLVRIQTVLPDYEPLDYVYDTTKNNFYNNAKKFGVAIGSATNNPTTTKSITLLGVFTVVLTTDYMTNDNSDADLQDAILVLQDAISEVYLDVVNTKIGIPDIVYDIQVETIATPLIFEEAKVVQLDMDLSIIYRQSLL